MSVPAFRNSKSKVRRRRSKHGLKPITIVIDKKTGEPHLPHHKLNSEWKRQVGDKKAVKVQKAEKAAKAPQAVKSAKADKIKNTATSVKQAPTKQGRSREQKSK
jgi:ribosomal protein L32